MLNIFKKFTNNIRNKISNNNKLNNSINNKNIQKQNNDNKYKHQNNVSLNKSKNNDNKNEIKNNVNLSKSDLTKNTNLQTKSIIDKQYLAFKNLDDLYNKIKFIKRQLKLSNTKYSDNKIQNIYDNRDQIPELLKNNQQLIYCFNLFLHEATRIKKFSTSEIANNIYQNKSKLVANANNNNYKQNNEMIAIGVDYSYDSKKFENFMNQYKEKINSNPAQLHNESSNYEDYLNKRILASYIFRDVNKNIPGIKFAINVKDITGEAGGAPFVKFLFNDRNNAIKFNKWYNGDDELEETNLLDVNNINLKDYVRNPELKGENTKLSNKQLDNEFSLQINIFKNNLDLLKQKLENKSDKMIIFENDKINNLRRKMYDVEIINNDTQTNLLIKGLKCRIFNDFISFNTNNAFDDMFNNLSQVNDFSKTVQNIKINSTVIIKYLRLINQSFKENIESSMVERK